MIACVLWFVAEEDVELVIGDGAVDGTDPNIRGDEDEVMSEEIRVRTAVPSRPVRSPVQHGKGP